MKNSTKTFHLKRILCIAIAIIGIIGSILCSFKVYKSYTYEYMYYNYFKQITELEKLCTYLNELELDYTIKDNIIILEKYNSICFEVDFNDTSVSIIPNNMITNFEILDNTFTSDIIIFPNKKVDIVDERKSIYEHGNVYIKDGICYYVKSYNYLAGVIMGIAITIAGTILSLKEPSIKKSL